jgi:ammonium transporter, Amt family
MREKRLGSTVAALGALVVALFLPAVAGAQEGGLDSGDTAWMLTATALVLFMTLPGLALFYAGMVRSKNVLSVLMQCFAIAGLMTVLWVVYGYSLVFDDTGMEAGVINLHSFIGGLDRMFLSGMTVDSLAGTIPESVFATFQLTFAIITPGADRRCLRRTDEILRVDVVHGPVVHPLLCADRAHGLGR